MHFPKKLACVRYLAKILIFDPIVETSGVIFPLGRVKGGIARLRPVTLACSREAAVGELNPLAALSFGVGRTCAQC